MANGTQLNAGTGGDNIMDFDDGVHKWQATVCCYATSVVAGSAGLVPITTSAGLPVAQQGAWNIGTLTTLTGITNPVAVTGTFWQATQPVSLASVPSHAVTNAGTFAVQATQAGTWTVTGAGGTFPVTGTFWQATQPVSIASTVSSTQSGTWTVQPGNTANTTPWLANSFDPAATSGNITAPDVVVSSASGQNSQSILTGTPTANSSVTVAVNSATAIGFQVTGTWTGTLVFERSIDGGTTYTPASVFLHGVSGAALASVTANCLAHSNCGGSTHFRVRATALASGTAVVKLQPSYGPSIVAASGLAGTNLLGQTAASAETGTVYNGTTALTPKFATFSTSSSGATTVVALVGGKRIRVLRWRVTSNGTTNIKWQSHVTPTDISGLSYLAQFKDCGGGWCPAGHFQTVSGEALDINNSAAIAISGEVTYLEV